jgi:hypothetical protein
MDITCEENAFSPFEHIGHGSLTTMGVIGETCTLGYSEVIEHEEGGDSELLTDGTANKSAFSLMTTRRVRHCRCQEGENRPAYLGSLNRENFLDDGA